LPEPTEADVVQFVGYDPGPDPNEPPRPARGESAEKVTVEVTIPKEVIGLTGARQQEEDDKGRASTTSGTPAGETRSLLTFIFLTLVAAAAGAVFLKYERNRALEQEGRSPSSEVGKTPQGAR
jgi:hypothetical protein